MKEGEIKEGDICYFKNYKITSAFGEVRRITEREIMELIEGEPSFECRLATPEELENFLQQEKEKQPDEIRAGDICFFGKYNEVRRATQRDIETDWSAENFEFRLTTPEEKRAFMHETFEQQEIKQQEPPMKEAKTESSFNILPQNWTTFRGRNVTMDSIDQQHLSNVYWYQQIFFGLKPNELFQIMIQLEERFNGQLLPYRPHLNFKIEIEELFQKNMIFLDRKKKSCGWWHYVIIFKKCIIGEIISDHKFDRE